MRVRPINFPCCGRHAVDGHTEDRIFSEPANKEKHRYASGAFRIKLSWTRRPAMNPKPRLSLLRAQKAKQARLDTVLEAGGLSTRSSGGHGVRSMRTIAECHKDGNSRKQDDAGHYRVTTQKIVQCNLC